MYGFAVTRSPGSKPSTSSPASRTSPQTSMPRIAGKSTWYAGCGWPRRIQMSRWLTEVARSRTSSSRGPGAGGLTAAIALERHGLDVVVYEQAPDVPRVGASLQLGPNALRLLDDLGLLPALRGIGVLPDAVNFVRWDDGSLLLHTPLGPAM